VDYKNQKRLPKSSWHQFKKALLNKKMKETNEY